MRGAEAGQSNNHCMVLCFHLLAFFFLSASRINSSALDQIPLFYSQMAWGRWATLALPMYTSTLASATDAKAFESWSTLDSAGKHLSGTSMVVDHHSAEEFPTMQGSLQKKRKSRDVICQSSEQSNEVKGNCRKFSLMVSAELLKALCLTCHFLPLGHRGKKGQQTEEIHGRNEHTWQKETTDTGERRAPNRIHLCESQERSGNRQPQPCGKGNPQHASPVLCIELTKHP